MKMDLRSLLFAKICVLYDIETQIEKALPKMAKAATDMELQKAFLDHLSETKNQITRLEQIFTMFNKKPKKITSEGIRGIIRDGKWVISHIEPDEARDANLVRAAQYVEHYEMSGYMGAIAWARQLGETEVATLLETTLGEEERADEKLRHLGEMLDKKVMLSLTVASS